MVQNEAPSGPLTLYVDNLPVLRKGIGNSELAMMVGVATGSLSGALIK